MRPRRLWMAVCVTAMLAAGLLGSTSVWAVNVTIENIGTTRIGNSLLVQVEIGPPKTIDPYWIQCEVNGVVVVPRILQSTVAFTLTDLTAASFPLTLAVFAYVDAKPTTPYAGSATTTFGASAFPAEISILESGDTIPDGGTDDVRTYSQATRVLRTYTIDNTAGWGAALEVTAVTATNLNNCESFTVETPLPVVAPAGGTGELTVSFAVCDPGDFSLEMQIANSEGSNQVPADENPYDITIIGERPRNLIIIPTGAVEGSLLDQGLDLPEDQQPPMIGIAPLSGVYSVGEVVTGGCQIVDADSGRAVISYVHAFIYALNLEARPERLTLVDHWMAPYNWSSHEFEIAWDTSGLAPGYYDLRLCFEDETSLDFRIELTPAAE